MVIAFISCNVRFRLRDISSIHRRMFNMECRFLKLIENKLYNTSTLKRIIPLQPLRLSIIKVTNSKGLTSKTRIWPTSGHYTNGPEIVNKYLYTYRSCDLVNNYIICRHYSSESDKVIYVTPTRLAIVFGSVLLTVFSVLYLKNQPEQKVQPEQIIGELESIPLLKDPINSDDIPSEIEYLLVGGGSAAFAASRTIKSSDVGAKILMVQDEYEFPYMRPPLSKELVLNDGEEVDKYRYPRTYGSVRSVFYEDEEFFLPCQKLNDSETGGIAIARGWSVNLVDPLRKLVILNDGKIIKYNKCLLATGSVPKKVPIIEGLPDKVKKKITYYHTLGDFKYIINQIREGVSSVAILGNEFLSCEMACSVAKKGEENDMNLKVTQIVTDDFVLRNILPQYLSKWLTMKIIGEGVDVVTGSTIKNISQTDDEKLEIVLSNGAKIVADHLLVCTDSEPNTKLAETSGLETDKENGGFVVNAELQLRTDLYAAGDCASYYDSILDRRRTNRTYDHAIISGQAAAENMIGKKLPFLHQAGSWTDIGNFGFETIGITNSNMRTVGFFAESSETESSEIHTQDKLDENNYGAKMQEMSSNLAVNESKFKKMNRYSKGVLFYLTDGVVDGIVMWNIFGRLPTARQVLRSRQVFSLEELKELAKYFDIYEDD